MNRLRDSLSPYLLQHAENPVDWYPWGEEAFAAAQRDDKPILLSIGYSACHWCHVMAHESFEDPETAALMNAWFVCIKVDREERPDVDDIYMQATLIFNQGHGGWPMTVFLTPDGRPFHAGTYYPKEEGRGMISFKRLLAAVNDAYRNRRDQVERVAADVSAGLNRASLNIGGTEDDLNPALLENAYLRAISSYDPAFGGLTRGQPKFPSPMNYEFLLNGALYHPALRERLGEVVTVSLRKMARGGIYDQIGGGFHRYSVDRYWLVPHFEKMLYDNAQLSRLYLHAWAATGDPFFQRIATEIYDYVLREMTSPEGGFYSATDADSEGEEGKFFVWSMDEIRAALPPEQAEAAIAYWGATERGNFEGRNILSVPEDDDKVARRLGIDLDTLYERLAAARQTLYTLREGRVHPGLDDKILTAWNGMMLASLAEAARLLGRADYLEAATRNAEFLFAHLKRGDRLLRSYRAGQAQFNGYLEDYANLIDGLIQLYMATFTPGYLAAALELAEAALAHFSAPDGGFFDTSDDHETLIARPRNLQDNATPSGNNLMAKVLLQLAAYTGEARYDAAARAVLRQLTGAIEQYPTAFGQAISAASMAINGIDEVAIVGDLRDPATLALLEVVNQGYRPNLILALAESEPGDEAFPPLLARRGRIGGQATAYVCRRFVCLQPVTSAEALAEQLRKP